MSRLRPLLLGLGIAFGCVVAPAIAQASSFDPSGFRFSSESYSVHENAGSATITVTRSDASRAATAYYVAVGIGHPCGAGNCNATPPQNGNVPEDFRPTQGSLAFPAGVTTETFSVPIVDHGFASIPKTLQLSIFNSWNEGRANPHEAVLTIINDDPTPAHDAANPLDLPVAPTNGNPLSGARFFVDPYSMAANAAKSYPAISVIANQPGAGRFGSFSGSDVGLSVNRYLVRADQEQPGTVPLLSTYRLVDGHCGNWTPTPGDQAAYHAWISRLAQGIGSHPAVMFLEMDSLITSPCLSPAGLTVRMNELRDAINVLNATCPHLVTYLDAGAGDAIPAGQTANLLRRSGVSLIQGFFLNSTHFDWTSNEIHFGEEVSRLTGGVHFIVNTAANGRGPLVPASRVRDGNEVLCNPPGRGLGPKPTTATGFANTDAFAWIGNPGESGGACVPGAPATGVYWPAYALMLVRNADFNVDHHVDANAQASRAKHKKHKKHKKVKKHAVKKHKKAKKHAVRTRGTGHSTRKTTVRPRPHTVSQVSPWPAGTGVVSGGG